MGKRYNGSSERLTRSMRRPSMTLARMYDTGRGVPQDYVQAATWYRRAAEQGHANAQNNVGVMYFRGEGVSQDHAAAAQWFQKAADQGNTNAQIALGGMYREGLGVDKDLVQAHVWYNLAAAQLGSVL